MSGRQAKEARRVAGVTPTVKVPTPVLERAGAWMERKNPRKKDRVEIRPSRLAVERGGVLDLGWRKPGKYLDEAGVLTEGARA